MDVSVELGHAGYNLGNIDEGGSQDTEGRGRHCDFDRVIDVCPSLLVKNGRTERKGGVYI